MFQCQAILPPPLRPEPAFPIAPYIWANPYIHLHHRNYFVIDSGTGTAVGYIVGTPNTKEYIKRYHAEYIPTLDVETQEFGWVVRSLGINSSSLPTMST